MSFFSCAHIKDKYPLQQNNSGSNHPKRRWTILLPLPVTSPPPQKINLNHSSFNYSSIILGWNLLFILKYLPFIHTLERTFSCFALCVPTICGRKKEKLAPQHHRSTTILNSWHKNLVSNVFIFCFHPAPPGLMWKSFDQNEQFRITT